MVTSKGRVSRPRTGKLCRPTQRLKTEFQATGQEVNLLQITFSTAIKTMGEGMASIARKQ